MLGTKCILSTQLRMVFAYTMRRVTMFIFIYIKAIIKKIVNKIINV